jgi:UDP-N-acetylmuramoyl-tripeptide--D-alanyl-D-alanine ligase
VAVVGLMAELGERSESDHCHVARLAEDLGVELVPVGTGAYGPEPVDPAAVETMGLGPGTAVLVKGSRVAGLDRLATRLLEL